MKHLIKILLLFLLLAKSLFAQKLLIPMDLSQTDHLKSYGVAYSALSKEINVEWLLNFRGGSFMTDVNDYVIRECRIKGVSYKVLSHQEAAAIYSKIEKSNMEVVLLEKAPKIAVYTPPNKQPWDDAVTLVLIYAEIPYKTLWDEEVLKGDLSSYDWLHLHHEDFTGQYGKFYATYHNAVWYKKQQILYEQIAHRLGFKKVSKLKLAVALAIKDYVYRGGFLFAMCSATDSYDIALAAQNTDICESVFDGDPVDPAWKRKLDFSQCLAFKRFTVYTDPSVYEFSDIDTTPADRLSPLSGRDNYFTLFEFSAKFDPVPTMLTQNHVSVIHNFMGQTTGFHADKIKPSVVIMARRQDSDEVKYIHGNLGKGSFTFLGGHDPEDYEHFVGDPPTDLMLHRNSPGYRLILNNILFPAAKKRKQKT